MKKLCETLRAILATLRVGDGIPVLTLFIAVIAFLQWLTFEKTDETMRVGQRAYVFLDTKIKTGAINPALDRQAVGVRYEFFNYGKTPAVFRGLYGTIKYFKTGFPSKSDIENAPGDTIDGEWIAPAGALTDYPFVTLLDVRKDELTAIRNGTGIYYFYGRLLYLDVFNASHTLTWCRMFHIEAIYVGGRGDCPWNSYN